MSAETAIAIELNARVTEAVRSSSIAGLAIQYPGLEFTPPNDSTYLEIIHVRNNRRNEYWTEERTYQGTVRLMLHWGKQKEGIIPAVRYLEELASSFAKGSHWTTDDINLLIYDAPDVGGIIVDNGRVMIPLSFPYRNFAFS